MGVFILGRVSCVQLSYRSANMGDTACISHQLGESQCLWNPGHNMAGSKGEGPTGARTTSRDGLFMRLLDVRQRCWWWTSHPSDLIVSTTPEHMRRAMALGGLQEQLNPKPQTLLKGWCEMPNDMHAAMMCVLPELWTAAVCE